MKFIMMTIFISVIYAHCHLIGTLMDEIKKLLLSFLALSGGSVLPKELNETTAAIQIYCDKQSRGVIEKAFPHLWGEYNSYEDEMYNLEQSASFNSFFRHNRVKEYLAELEYAPKEGK